MNTLSEPQPGQGSFLHSASMLAFSQALQAFCLGPVAFPAR